MAQLKDGIDFVTGNVLSFQQMNRMKNNWYSGADAPANPVNGMVWVKNDGITYVYFGAAWNPLSTVAEFLDLTDTPAAYAGEGGKFVKVNAVPDALEFAAIVWGDVSKVGSNLTDLATRQHAGLTDVTTDQHHAQDHAAEHEVAGGDLLDFTKITGFGDYLDQAVKEASSPTFVTAKLSGLTDGYVPYHVDDATGLADSPIFTDGTNAGIGTATPGCTLNIVHPNTAVGGLMLQTTQADATQKDFRFKVAHYTNAEEPVTLMLGTAGIAALGNLIKIGGGSGIENACTHILFYTAPNTTTLRGTEGMRIEQHGNIGIGQTTFGTNAATVLAQGTGTAPTTSPADAFQMYSADQAAGNACAHFRTENSAIIKLYQQAHIVDAPGDTAANNAITINAILTALENAGFLAAA